MSCTCHRAAWIALVLVAGILETTICCGQETGAWQPPDSLDQLPSAQELPELLRMTNGQQIRTPEQWQQHRTELKDMLQYYEYGHLPPRPDSVTADQLVSSLSNDPAVVQQRLELVIGTREQLRMQVAISRPQPDGRYPVIVTEVHSIAPLPCIPLFIEQGYMFVQYQRENLAPDRADVVSSARQAYPNQDGATLAIWAWGAMRVVDYLETRCDVDLARVAITGHSRGGKAALLAGALDERFALVAPNGSGCGGAGCFRDTPRTAESLEQITDPRRFGYWFHPRLRWFAGREDRLPFDQHFLKALVAPRALLCTEARGDLWANPPGTIRTSQAAQQVFQFLAVPDKQGLHFREGQHDQTLEDWQALLTFAQWHFRGIPPDDITVFQVPPPEQP